MTTAPNNVNDFCCFKAPFFSLLSLLLIPSPPRLESSITSYLSFLQPALYVFLALTSLAYTNRGTFPNPLFLLLSRVSFQNSLPFHGKCLEALIFCHLACSTKLPVFTTPSNTVRKSRCEHLILSE